MSRWIGLSLLVAVTVAIGAAGPAVDGLTSQALRGVLAAIGGVGILSRPWWAAHADRAMGVGLVVVTLGWLNYWQFSGAVFGGITDHSDTAYYYTNSKYLAELGYDGLYDAMLICEDERGRPRTAEITTVRDLRTDALEPRAASALHGERVKAAFSPERWAAFCHDATYFLDRIDRRSLRISFFLDHGYNPPPTWTVVGGNLARLVDVEHLKWICWVDVGLVAAMFGFVAWAFGPEPVLWGMLFFTVTVSGRWPILGQAIGRFDWLAALVAGTCLLKKERYGLAGAAFAYAALNRVFPVLFFAAWAVEAATDTVRSRRIAGRHLRFAGGAALVALALGTGALAQFGAHTFRESAQELAKHDQSFSSHRVGLATVTVWRGETTKDELRAKGGLAAKEQRVRALQPVFRGVGVVALLLVAAVGWRARKRAWELVPLVMLPLFLASAPQVNYLNYRVLGVVGHAEGAASLRHRLGVAALFGTEAAAQATRALGWEPHATNAVGSWGLLLYFVGIAAAAVHDVVRPPADAPNGVFQRVMPPAPPSGP